MATIQCQQRRFDSVRAVIFDKDGTLADSAAFLKQLAHQRSHFLDQQVLGVGQPLLTAFGLVNGVLNPAGLMAVGSRRENEIAAATYVAATGRGWIESLAIAQAAFAAADQAMPRKAALTPLFAGSRELLQALQSAGLKLAILSSDTTANVRDFVQCYQLEPYFELLMGTEQGPTKPDPRLFLQACQALAVPPEAALMVGDSEADVEMARRAGAIGCIGIQQAESTAIALTTADVVITAWCEMHVLSERKELNLRFLDQDTI